MMHEDDLAVTDALIHDLLGRHTPLWAGRPVQQINTTGTDNALYRIGQTLVLRIPRRAAAIPLITKELDWLAHLSDLPLATPTLRYRGHADLGMDCPFGIFDWIDGTPATPENIADADAAAVALAAFLNSLHQKATIGAPRSGTANMSRGVPLAEMSERTLAAITILADEIDTGPARRLWDTALAETHRGQPVWLHGDLKADNLLALDGRLSAVIDWGLSAVGDPAADYAAAWFWVSPSARHQFRNTLEAGDGDWLRGKAWALYGAVIALSYYRGGRNEPLCRQCRLTLSRLDLLV
ncbi:aminoglycoside phosphotransferase family protein [Martelella sp. HB161492]|uniref:aminoglycoside phosphotransferase family protein n=1 Tax=Martelella sp. HB161492 TaxID=2720726 RepID=UPI00159193B0|nr:aminoglycoside phosphotransferase family protein [Martelella sp. HB161492]